MARPITTKHAVLYSRALKFADESWLLEQGSDPERLEWFIKGAMAVLSAKAKQMSDDQILAMAPPGITKHSYLKGWRDAEAAHKSKG